MVELAVQVAVLVLVVQLQELLVQELLVKEIMVELPMVKMVVSRFV
jgi:hypothetical protein